LPENVIFKPDFMFEVLENTDRELFLYLNGGHNDFFDAVMPYLTGLWIWLPLFAWWLYRIYRKYHHKTVIITIFTLVLILASDQGSGLVKNTVKRYRPTHNTEIKDKVHVVNDYRGGQFGFISSHAANAFAVALFIFLLMRKSGLLFTLSLFLYAILTSYSRIYLGVHYPSDILGGALLGTLLAFLFHKIYLKYAA
jgi:undecaprenyl-diphosphatase